MRLERSAGNTLLALTLVAGALSAGAPLAAATAFAPNTPAGFDRIVVFGAEGVSLGAAVRVRSGDVVVNRASSASGASRDGSFLRLAAGASTPAGFAVRADRVELGRGAVIGGQLLCNQVSADGRPIVPSGSLRLPVFPALPPFRVAAPGAGTRDVVVPSGQTVSLAPGRYLELRIKTGGRVLLTGGAYHFSAIQGEARTGLLFAAPTEVRVSDRLVLGPGSVLAPAQAGAAALVYVGGDDRAAGAAPAVSLGAQSVLAATVYAPYGRLSLGPRSQATGALIARQVSVGNGSLLALASGLRDDPPPDGSPVAAEPQLVSTLGEKPLKIVLAGSATDRGDLEFSIASFPRKGKLDGPDPIVPEPVFDPDRQETVQPPVRSARVVYTPASGESVRDAFVFQVTDRKGQTAQAEVGINQPPGDELPPSESVDAIDVQLATLLDSPVVVTLPGNAPEGVALDFAIVDKPLFGTLGKLVAGTEVPRRTARVQYLPERGHLGQDVFTFMACGLIGRTQACDRASATVDTRPDPDAALRPAYDQELATLRGTAVEVHLTGTPRGGDEKIAFTVVQLPRQGQLSDSRGNLIRDVPYGLADGVLIYRPVQGFVGDDVFSFQGADSLGTAVAKMTLHVIKGRCADSVAFCDDGR